jgi:1-acyl-sn-glycerol-3-phosphate acyltransferase
VAETRETEQAKLDELRARVHGIALDLLNTAPDDIVLAPPHTVLKTSSGKIRRSACRELYDRGALGKAGRAVWLQIARMALEGAAVSLRRWSRAGLRAVYAGYAWGVFGPTMALVWLGVAALPMLAWRQWLVKGAARGFLMAAGMPLVVRGIKGLPRGKPAVLAVNHASYLDALVLSAALPIGLAYVAKRELASVGIVRFFYRRLGTEFVERIDPQRGIEDTERLVEAVRQGRSLVMFPEGTFGRAPGLRPFRMGAFVVAARANAPVVPVIIGGTRSILRDGSWFPRRGVASVTAGDALWPQGSDWNAALALRDAARAEMLKRSGEPDLQPLMSGQSGRSIS